MSDNLTKYVEVKHGFWVSPDVTNEQLGNLVGTMTVQVEEPVVGYSDDMSMNELTIDVGGIDVGWRSYDTFEVWVVSHVAGITGDGDTSTGGFMWYPAPTLTDEEAKALLADEVKAWRTDIARVRLLKVRVPRLSYIANEKVENLAEGTRTRITEWLDTHLEDVEYHWPAIETRWVYPDEGGRAALLSDLMYLTRDDPEYPGRRKYIPSADESAEIKAFLREHRDHIHEDGHLANRVALQFPLENDEVWAEETDEEKQRRINHILATNIIKRAKLLGDAKPEDFTGLEITELDTEIESVTTALARRGKVPNEGLFEPDEED